MLNWENNMKKSELKSLVQEVIKETKTSKKVIIETPQRTALKKLIKETIGAMGYVDIGAVGSPIPVSNNAVNALLGRKKRIVKEVVADKQIWKNLVESLSDLAQVFENYSVGEIIGDLKGKELKISDIQKLDRMVTDVTNYIS
jgi:hypothetical protein